MIKKIGMRNIKTAIAVTLCIVFFAVFGQNGFYAGIAAVVCIQSTIQNSFKAGLMRFSGTVIGGFIGFITMEVLIFSPDFLDVLWIFLSISITIYLCVLLKKSEACQIACIVLLSLILNHTEPNKALFYAVERVVDTSIGIGIAVCANKFIDIDLFKNLFNKIGLTKNIK